MLRDRFTVRAICGLLAVWDVGLFVTALLAPWLLHDLMQPGIPLEGGWWIRRTAWVWLAFAVAQLRAYRRPASGERVRLVAFLRAADAPADLTWWLFAPGLGLLGRVTLLAFPLINLWLAWRLAAAADALQRDRRW